MPGHLYEVTEMNGDKYFIVTKVDSENQARELFRKVFGSTNNVYTIEYVRFVHACQE